MVSARRNPGHGKTWIWQMWMFLNIYDLPLTIVDTKSAIGKIEKDL